MRKDLVYKMYKLLIVEDEYSSRQGIRTIIDWSMYNIEIVAEAVNGIDGNEKALKYKPDIIITDICMNGINGLEMIYSLKNFLPKTIFIVLTGYRDFEYMREAIKLKIFDYILKPIDIEEFKKTISRSVDELDNIHCDSPVKKKLMIMKNSVVNMLLKNEDEAAIMKKFDEYFDYMIDNLYSDSEKYSELGSLIVKFQEISPKHKSKSLNFLFTGDFDVNSWREVLKNAIARIADSLSNDEKSKYTMVLKIKQYIDENFCKNINLDDVVTKNTTMNKYYVNNMFKQIYNESVGDYINRLRMKRATEILAEEDISVNDVAARCGFVNQKYFSVLFKKTTGLTPGEYRRLNKR